MKKIYVVVIFLLLALPGWTQTLLFPDFFAGIGTGVKGGLSTDGRPAGMAYVNWSFLLAECGVEAGYANLDIDGIRAGYAFVSPYAGLQVPFYSSSVYVNVGMPILLNKSSNGIRYDSRIAAALEAGFKTLPGDKDNFLIGGGYKLHKVYNVEHSNGKSDYSNSIFFINIGYYWGWD